MIGSAPRFARLLALASAPGRAVKRLERYAGELRDLSTDPLVELELVASRGVASLTPDVPATAQLEAVLLRLRQSAATEETLPPRAVHGRPNRVAPPSERDGKRKNRQFPHPQAQGTEGTRKVRAEQRPRYEKRAVPQEPVSPTAQRRIHSILEGMEQQWRGDLETPTSDPTRSRPVHSRQHVRLRHPVIRTAPGEAPAGRPLALTSEEATRRLHARTTSTPAHQGWNVPLGIDPDPLVSERFAQISKQLLDDGAHPPDPVPDVPIAKRADGHRGGETGNTAATTTLHRTNLLEDRPLADPPGSSPNIGKGALPRETRSPSHSTIPTDSIDPRVGMTPSDRHTPALNDPSVPTGLRGLAARFGAAPARTTPAKAPAVPAPERSIAAVLREQREEAALAQRLDRILRREARRQGIDVEEIDR